MALIFISANEHVFSRKVRSPGMSSDLKSVDSKKQADTTSSGQKRPATSAVEQHEQDHAMGGTYHSDTIYQLRQDPDAISQLFKEGKYPYTDRVPGHTYEEEKAQLQVELLKVQNWVKMTGQKIVIIFEGRDAAGKGGTIKRFMEHLNPRAAKVVALEKPTEHERGQWYFQRYVVHLPTQGEILFLDRSWYNRAGVERRQCPEFERMLVNSGIKLFKYYFSVTRKEQRHRFASRMEDPLKQWKLSPVDKASVGLWHEYTRAKEAMFFYADTASCPWTIVKSDDKKRARLNCMQHFLSKLNYPDKNLGAVTGPDPLIVGSPSQVIRKDVHLDAWPNV
jgi:polyphosphate kinase 2